MQVNIDLFFYEHPVFRYEEFASWKTSQGAIREHSINTALQHYLKSGRIMRLRRGLYAVVPPNQSPETMTIDPYLIAALVVEDSILAYHTALELHGVAYSAFQKFTFTTQQKIKLFFY